MSDLTSKLGNPTALKNARIMAHAAAQILTKAARANIAPAPDDSHSNLEWSFELQMFLTQPLKVGTHQFHIGLALAPLTIVFQRDGITLDDLALAGRSLVQVDEWIDTRLREARFKVASTIDLPYKMPIEVDEIDRFSESDVGLAELSTWYALATSALTELAEAVSGSTANPSPVRCWPHHFDIATYVSLQTGDLETSMGIGVGLSPGDESYDQPYFYVNPWPHLDAATLPPAVEPGHWHTQGFVGSIATGVEILSLADPLSTSSAFLRESFNVGKSRLGI